MAVPTVMGIASIRVYTVSQVPTDGLVTREKVWLSQNVWSDIGVRDISTQYRYRNITLHNILSKGVAIFSLFCGALRPVVDCVA